MEVLTAPREGAILGVDMVTTPPTDYSGGELWRCCSVRTCEATELPFRVVSGVGAGQQCDRGGPDPVDKGQFFWARVSIGY